MFEKYNTNIVCSHLHNNFKSDTHNILSDGEIDYKYYINELLKIKGASNCLECFPPFGEILSKQQFVEFVNKCFILANKI